MSFTNQFLEGRLKHLHAKLRATEDALNKRVDLLQAAREYKESVLIPQILNAIERHKNGTYGICLGCEKEIARERLLLYPHVDRCVSCQTKKEKNGRKGAPRQI